MTVSDPQASVAARNERLEIASAPGPKRWRARYLADLLGELIKRDLKVRYQRSMLGIGWSLLKPLSQLAIFLFVFGHVMPLSIPFYATYLLAGVLSWSWFGQAVTGASTSITGNPELSRRPGFPAAILPVVTVLSEGIHFVLALPILFAVACWETGFAGPVLLALPAIVTVQFLFTLGLAYFVAASHVRFRDTQDAVGVAVMLGFYVTPVFYQAKDLHGPYALVSMFNPMAHILTAYRTVLIDHQVPALVPLLILGALSFMLLFAGIRLFQAVSSSFAEEM